MKNEETTTEQQQDELNAGATEKESLPCPAAELIKKWLMGLDYKTKLACWVMHVLMFGDHGTGDLANDVLASFEGDILDVFGNPDSKTRPDELLVTGVAVEQSLWLESDRR